MLFAAKARTPMIGVICDPKIAYFSEKLDMPASGPVEAFCPDALLAQVQEVLADRASFQARLSATVAEMDQGARENGAFLQELLASSPPGA